jgi:hypothetical protein
MWIHSRAWRQFHAKPWAYIAARFNETAAIHLEFQHMADPLLALHD